MSDGNGFYHSPRIHWGNEWPPQEDLEVFSWS